jgi:hypothetical protein
MRAKPILHGALVCLVLALCLASCVAPPPSEEQTTAPAVTDDFESAVDDAADSELAKRYTEYNEKAALAFKDAPDAPKNDFEYEISEKGVTLTSYIGQGEIIVIPDEIDGKNVTHIAENAFEGANIRAIYIPDTVKTISAGALAGCTALSTLRLPLSLGGEGADYLGYVFGADEYAENAITVPTTLDMVIVGEGAAAIPDNYFAGCKTLSAVVLPQTVTKIGEFAFYECRDLVYVGLGTSVAEVGQYAFASCENLFAIDLGKAKLGLGVLYSCNSLNRLTLLLDGKHLGYVFDAEISDYNAMFVPKSLRTVMLSEGEVKITPKAFYGCQYLTAVILPETLEDIGARAFYGCRSLTEIELGDLVATLGEDSFFGCDALQEVTLGSGLVTIGMQAFYGCSSLKEITIPQKVTEIKQSTFAGCTSLEEVDLGKVTQIGKDAFLGCNAIESVKVLDGAEIADGNGALTGAEK